MLTIWSVLVDLQVHVTLRLLDGLPQRLCRYAGHHPTTSTKKTRD